MLGVGRWATPSTTKFKLLNETVYCGYCNFNLVLGSKSREGGLGAKPSLMVLRSPSRMTQYMGHTLQCFVLHGSLGAPGRGRDPKQIFNQH